jgi:hypothetical protein
MKNIILVVVILSIINCKAQTNIMDMVNRCNSNSINHNNGSVYLKDISNVFNPYVGTWKWTEGSKEMTLTLIKQTKFHYNQGTDNFYSDRLVGYYIYKENGVILANTSNDNLMDDYGLNVNFYMSCDSNLGTSSFTDVNKNKSYEVWLEMMSPTQFKFHGKIGESTYYRPKTGTIYYPAGTTFPLEMVFNKQ